MARESIAGHLAEFGTVVEWYRRGMVANADGGFDDMTLTALAVPSSAVILHRDGPVPVSLPGAAYVALTGTVTLPMAVAEVVREGDRFTTEYGEVWRLNGPGSRSVMYDAASYPCETQPKEVTP